MKLCRWNRLFLALFLLACNAGATEANRLAGQRFLEANATQEGIVTTESGLQYRILVEGDGPRPGPTDKVEVYYQGYLLDGTVFDETDIIRPPAVFQVDLLIDGWSEALQLMPVRSIWEVYIPSDLAYGARDTERIPAHSTLHFEVELVSILP
jgi:FKBP-type peptidyl-prolyl cis-trans isomerase